MVATIEESRFRVGLDPLDDQIAPGISDRLVLTIARVAFFAGIVAANVYGWSLTASGLIRTKLLPDNIILPPPVTAVLVAFFIQVGIVGFYLCIPYFRKRHLLLNIITSMLCLCLICISAIFALFSITMTSQGANLFALQAQQIAGLDGQVRSLDQQMTDTYNLFVTNHHQLHNAACGGDDETGIKKCGSIANAYAATANAARAAFGPSLGAMRQRSPTNPSDLGSTWTALRSDLADAQLKAVAFEQFGRRFGISTQGYRFALTKVASEEERLSALFADRIPDSRTIVLDDTFKKLGDVFSLRASPQTLFEGLIAILPDVLSVTLALLTMIARAASRRVMSINSETSKMDDEANAFERLADSIKRRTQSWWNFANARRNANVLADVDDRVSDISSGE